MAQKYETIAIEGPLNLHVGDLWTGFKVMDTQGPTIELQWSTSPNKTMVERFGHDVLDRFIEAGNNTVERPVAEEPVMVTFEAILVGRLPHCLTLDPDKIEDTDGLTVNSRCHVTVTEKPHTAVMGKVVAEAILDDRNMNMTQTVNGGYEALGHFVEEHMKPGVKVIVVDENAEAELTDEEKRRNTEQLNPGGFVEALLEGK